MILSASIPLSVVVAEKKGIEEKPIRKKGIEEKPIRKKGIERLREAKMMLQEGFIEQAEFDEVKSAVLAQMKG